MQKLLLSSSVAICLSVIAYAQDVDSGPALNKKAPKLKVHICAGPDEGKTLNIVGTRKGKDTLFVVIPEQNWSRPVHRFIRGLGKSVDDKIKDGLVVAVWLTKDDKKTKTYLPKIAQYYMSTALTYCPGKPLGPNDWGLNDQAITVIGVSGDRVVTRLGYNSINETVVKEVMSAFMKSRAKE